MKTFSAAAITSIFIDSEFTIAHPDLALVIQFDQLRIGHKILHGIDILLVEALEQKAVVKSELIEEHELPGAWWSSCICIYLMFHIQLNVIASVVGLCGVSELVNYQFVGHPVVE